MMERSGNDKGQAGLKRLSVMVSVSVMVVLVVIKLVAWLASGSLVVLSSLLDSALDLISALISAWSIRHANQPADAEHRFGHAKAEPAAALVQSVFVAASGLLIAVEAVQRLFAGDAIALAPQAAGLMVLSAVLVGGLIIFQRHVVRRTGSLAIAAEADNYRGDMLAYAAVIAALLATEATGARWIDPVIALAIAGFLLWNARRIAIGSLDVLMDRELDEGVRERILAQAESEPGVHGAHDLRTRSDGARNFVELHLEVDGRQTLAQAHRIAHRVSERIRDDLAPAEVLVHLDPHGLEEDRLDDAIEAAENRKQG